MLDEENRERLKKGKPPHFWRGWLGEAKISEAFARAKRFFLPGTLEYNEMRDITREQFLKLGKRWGPRVECVDLPMRNQRRARPPTLSDAEWYEAVRIVSTPTGQGSAIHAFRSIADCMDRAHTQQQRFRELVRRSELTPTRFRSELYRRFPSLQFRKVDKMPALNRDTLRQRKHASDIWGGRAPWREHCAPARAAPGRGAGLACGEPVFWEKRWYGEFVFQVDATKYSDMHSFSEDDEYAFYWAGEVPQPEEHRAAPSVGHATILMFYSVIHPRLGTVVGPSLMYWGSNKTTSASTKQRHPPDFPSWCALSYAEFTCLSDRLPHASEMSDLAGNIKGQVHTALWWVTELHWSC